MEHAALLFWLLVGHCLCDYPLQGDLIAKAKNHTAPVAGFDWWLVLAVHSLIHAGAVAYITHNPIAAILEFVAHFVVDHEKCDGAFGFRTDQALHVLCKVAWVWVTVGVPW